MGCLEAVETPVEACLVAAAVEDYLEEAEIPVADY